MTTQSGDSAMEPKGAESPEMPGGTMQDNPLIERIVDQVMTQISDNGERTLVRTEVAAAVRRVVEQAAEQEHALGLGATNGAMALGDATSAAMAVAKQVKELGFVEFTAGLITGTFDAIVGATIKQMDAYAKLVADLSKTLAQFQTENISDAQINSYLATRYPDDKGGTVVRADYTFTPTAEGSTPAKTANDKLKEVANAINFEGRRLTPPLALTIDAAAVSFTAQQVRDIFKAMGQILARNMMDHLAAMARMGMARIVITDGEILSKLTFNVSATDQQAARQAKYHSDSAGAYIRGGAWAPWGSVAGGASWNQLNVSSVNESSFNSVTMNAQMIGQVDIHFKTDAFPAFNAPTPA